MGMPESQKDYLENLKPTEPTIREESYIKELEKRGFTNINLDIPDIGRNALGESDYAIRLNCPFNLTINNQDSVIKISDGIIDELYSNVIEDSIIYDCKAFHVVFSVQQSEIDDDRNILSQHYTKPSLEQWNGFKVVKVGSARYKRVSVK
jgi:hypothetical protein